MSYDAIVVGAGPNGLAGALTLARHGLSVLVLEAADEVGGGTRTAELIQPGVLHDISAAVHPFGVNSPFLTEGSLDLERHGLVWRWPEIDVAHPLDGGRAAVMVRSLEETARGLGVDGAAWRRLFDPVTASLDDLLGEVFRPVVHVPRHPVALARFGLRGLPPVTVAARRWRDGHRALFAGVAAHAIQPLSHPLTSAIGVLLLAAGHRRGWPVAEGGSQAIARAMAARLAELGGTIETGVTVRSLGDLPASRIVLLDVAPRAAVELCGDRMPARVRRAYGRFRHGPAAFKLDLVVEGGVPWAAADCRRAGTVHCGGTLEEIAAAERAVHAGRMPERPFVLVAQQHLADPTRSDGDRHPLWAYAHVPHGYTGDATDAVLGQIERFAPGLRDRILGLQVRGPAVLAAHNANYVGGDIATGATSARQILFRPRVALDPYATGVPGVYLCSAATPPGAGVHGMCGVNAAESALRDLA